MSRSSPRRVAAHGVWRGCIALVLLSLSAVESPAQRSCVPRPLPVVVGSEWERYLRIAQLSGDSLRQPWTLRAFGPQQTPLLPRDSSPIGAGLAPAPLRARCLGIAEVAVLPARVRLIYNSAFPLGKNDAAVWEGRGVTAVGEGGVSFRAGFVRVTLAPLVFVAQNAAFSLAPNGFTDERAFADWRNPQTIDLPQRFGGTTYAQFDLGQSSVRADLGPLAIALTTENEFWGPAIAHPIIIGNNAAGFPRLAVGTSRPVAIPRVGRLHGRVFYGRPTHTRYSPVESGPGSRLSSGIAAVFQPAFLPGLEMGAGRFFHVLQDQFTLNAAEIARPFRGGTPRGEEAAQNQLASVFARLVLGSDGVEVYGEFGKDDRNNHLREFWLIPDHDAAYLLGLQKAWRAAGGRGGDITVVRGELVNGRVTHLALTSQQSPWYVHGGVRQGHTNRGQALGSAALYGGGASLIAVERYNDRGRRTLSWERLQLGDSRQAFHAAPSLLHNDVAHQWSVDVLRLGRRADLEFGASVIYEINRQLRGDAFSLRTAIGISPGARARP
jgi:hypothetical protein